MGPVKDRGIDQAPCVAIACRFSREAYRMTIINHICQKYIQWGLREYSAQTTPNGTADELSSKASEAGNSKATRRHLVCPLPLCVSVSISATHGRRISPIQQFIFLTTYVKPKTFEKLKTNARITMGKNLSETVFSSYTFRRYFRACNIRYIELQKRDKEQS